MTSTGIKDTLSARGICVVIPTYNNAATLEGVVCDCKSHCNDVIVVNDGSTDDTRQILQSIDEITVVDYTENQGKGYALKTGFRKALEMGFSYAITIDSDGQHYAEDIEKFLKANQQHPGALVVGKRNMEGKTCSQGSRFANRFSNFWFYIQTGNYLSDTQTGYRLYPLKRMKGLSLLTSRYEAELELLVFASWHGVEIAETEINVFYPPAEERVSHFRPGADFARISILNTVLCFLAVIYGLPLRLWRAAARVVRTVIAILFTIFFIMMIISPCVWLYMNIGQKTEKKRRNLHRFLYKCSRLILLKIGVPGTTFSYKIGENEDFKKPSVIICNHQSHLDLMCQMMLAPNIVFLTNQWVWNNPLYGAIIRNAEFYPIAEGVEALLPKLRSLVERGYHIGIFPEGTRSTDCHIQRFHQGAFYIASQLGVDIVPMYLYGTGKVLPKKKHLLNKSKMYIEVGERLSQEKLQLMGSIRNQTSVLNNHYRKKYAELCNIMERE